MGSDQKRAFLAILLSGVVLYVWQFFFTPKKVDVIDSPVGQEVVKTVEKSSKNVEKTQQTEGKATQAVDNSGKTVEIAPKEIVKIDNSFASSSISNRLVVSELTDKLAVFKFQDVTGSENAVQIYSVDNNIPKLLNFNIVSRENNKLVMISQSAGITGTFSMSDKGRLLVNLKSDQPHRYRFQINSSKASLDNRQTRQFVLFGKKVERINVGDDEKSDGNFKWFGLDFNFHLLSIVFPEKTTARYQTFENGQMIVDLVQPSKLLQTSVLFTKKNYDHLKNQGDNLHLAVDFGFFGIIAVPILRGLQFFYKYLSNYGLAIILITLIMRMLTFPLQYKSFKSMKKMQKIQPELAKLKEKYSDDPQRMQKETMELFKKAGANPLSGCLPMVLQMPVFIAFYQVLYNAVEFVNAPFYFWIHDLSVKDPYYVLPVLMGIVMLIQSKLNPSTSTDPTQKKIMWIMPIVFTFIMKDLPAGLNLYMTVSISMGVIQQLLVYRTTD